MTRTLRCGLIWCVLLVARFSRHAHALIEDDGRCSLVTFVPFTKPQANGSAEYVGRNTTSNLGFSHMAAAVMAMDHFNERDSSVVPELAQDVYTNCNVTFDRSNRSRFFDTGTATHLSSKLLMQYMLENGGIIPCAIAGPHNHLPSQLLSTMAASVSIPLVAHRAYNMRFNDPFYSPFSNQVYPSQRTTANVLVSFLKLAGRNNYTSLLYNIRDTAVQRHEMVRSTLEAYGFRYNSYPFQYNFDYALGNVSEEVDDPKLGLAYAFGQMKKDGYRTIVAIMEFPEVELPLLAHEAEVAEMNGGDYVWIFLGADLSSLSLPPVNTNLSLLRLLAGGVMISPLEGFQVPDNDNDKFAVAWKSHDATFVNRVNALNSIAKGMPGFYEAGVDYFQSMLPLPGAGFMYDAVMAIGLGACLAAGSAADVTGELHLAGIRSTDFMGATGRVKFGDGNEAPGGRNSSFVKYGVVNLLRLFALEEDESKWTAMLSAESFP
jgi:Receptor family ligand binding region